VSTDLSLITLIAEASLLVQFVMLLLVAASILSWFVIFLLVCYFSEKETAAPCE